MTTTTNAWTIRPITMANGTRRFQPVAKLASGEEVECGMAFHATVRSARLFIISRFDGGRSFPKPDPAAHAALMAVHVADDAQAARMYRGYN